MSIADWPRDERPREKLLARGPGVLSDAELLALFIHTGTRSASAIDLARTALDQTQGLRGLLDLDPARLATISGIGPARSALLKARGRARHPVSRRTGPAQRRPHQPRSHQPVPVRPAALAAARGIRLSVSRQPASGHQLRGDVPGHHRRRERASARGRQTRPRAQRGGPHRGAQPPLGRRRAEPVGPRDHPAGCGTRWSWWT